MRTNLASTLKEKGKDTAPGKPKKLILQTSSGKAKLRILVLLIVLGVLIFSGWRIFIYRSDIDKGLAQLRTAYKGQRPTESLSSAGFEFAPLTELRGSKPKPADSDALTNAERLIIGAVVDGGSAGAHQALGLVHLSKGEIEKALGELSAAVDLEPNNPAINSDFGSAYLERAGTAQSGEEFFININLALRHIARALERNPGQRDALYNRALALRKMTLHASAAKAWNTYIEKDPSSPWAAEARENIARSVEDAQPVKENSQVLADYLAAFRTGDRVMAWKVVSETKETVTGVMVQKQLTTVLLAAHEQKNTETVTEMIAALRFLGELEYEHAKDPFFRELAAHYAGATDADLTLDLEAQRAMTAGDELVLKEEFAQALAAFENAKALFEKAGNTWESLIAEYQACYTVTQADDITKSKERLLALTEICERKNYRWVRSLAEVWIGANLSLRGEFSSALEADGRALDLATGASDVYNIQRSLVQIADQYGFMGNQEQALTNVHKSLTFPVSYHAFPRQRMRNLYFTTNMLYRFRLYEAAVEYAQALVDLTDQLPDRWMNQVGRNQLAASYGGLKRYPEALETAAQSMRIAETIPDEKLKKRLTITSLLTLARVQRQSGDCPAAIANYEKGVEILKSMESVMDKYDTLSGRFQCQVAEKDDEAIKTSMPEVLEFLDANRKRIKQETDRYIFFDGEQVVYDAAVGYVFSERRDPQAAFGYAETSRARSLLSLVVAKDGEGAAPLFADEIRSRMPAGVQMVYYAVLRDKLLIWYISNSKFESVELAVGADEIESKVAAYVETLRGVDGAAAKQAGKEFYPLLIKPVEALLEKDKTICFVADKSLFRVPFAAIVLPDGRYLVEDHAVVHAPSASIFIRLSEDAARKNAGSEETVLSIGNPAFSQKEYPKLADLPDAIEESETIASYYAGSKVLTGRGAVKNTVLDELAHADVVHFAGHYVPNLRWPKLSKFVLTEDLSVQEIMDNSISRPRLIVLSGCETGVEKFYNGEGMMGAARAFLASDVPVVVATQWPVETKSAARLMTKFHFYRKKQAQNSAAALRTAQLDLLREGTRFSSPYYWAGFTTIGGYSSY